MNVLRIVDAENNYLAKAISNCHLSLGINARAIDNVTIVETKFDEANSLID